MGIGESERSFKFTCQLWLVFIVVRLLMMTWRVKVSGMENRKKATAMNPRGSFVIASWHENAGAGVLSHPGQGIQTLCSRSKDGEFVAFICERIGLGAVRGSSSRGGKEAREQLVDHLQHGTCIAITVDGPKGPRRQAKSGVVDVSRKGQAYIIPITCIADRYWVLRKTWDNTRIPKPFSRLIVHYGEPIKVPEQVTDEHFEALRLQVEHDLNRNDDVVMHNWDQLWSKAVRFSGV
jgi:lysophospholipid acyltransferase (LPLAT)-like uncharacterized protein